jgi:ABC-2 type transport system ATP-binding protein
VIECHHRGEKGVSWRGGGPYSVEVEELVKVFGSFVAVDHITFQVRQGEVFGFLGPNGAGKSTTTRMLSGLLRPTSGQGHVEELDIVGESEKIKQIIGYMSQQFSLYEDLTVEENIDFYGGIYRIPRAKAKERSRWVLEMAGLMGRRKTLTRTLATGWKQRLALGCAIIHEPAVLFLDEPTSGVDPISRRQFWDLIYTLSEAGVTVFVTTHYMDEAENCHRIALIHQGRLAAIGTPEELRGKPMDRAILVLEGPKTLECMDALEKLEGCAEVGIFGNTLHITVDDVQYATRKIREFLADRSIGDFRLEPIDPSLEDVFVALIRSEEQKGEKPFRKGLE